MIIKKLFFIALFSLVAASAQAVIMITINEVGSDVVVVGSGTANLTNLAFSENTTSSGGIVPGPGIIVVGSPADQDGTLYDGVDGLTSFGSVDFPTFPSSGTGDIFGFAAMSSNIMVPLGYVSGSFLSGSSTYTGVSFSDLGLTPGTYTGTWGSGGNADSITLTVVPEPSTYASLAGLCTLGLAAIRRRKRV